MRENTDERLHTVLHVRQVLVGRTSVVLAALEQVIAERAVDPDLVRASVVLLDVEGETGTWVGRAPGTVLCSFDAALHERTSRTTVHAAFTARL